MCCEECVYLPLLLWRGVPGYSLVLLPKRKCTQKKQLKRMQHDKLFEALVPFFELRFDAHHASQRIHLQCPRAANCELLEL